PAIGSEDDVVIDLQVPAGLLRRRRAERCARREERERVSHGASCHRYPMPYTVSIAANAGSIARNFLRMRFTWDVMVPSSTTIFASPISWSRSFTCPGWRASECTIQN